MQPVNTHETPRRDPAPSRLSYRIQRWWLTPFFRRLVRQGLPAFAMVFFGLWFWNDQENRDVINDKIAEIRQSVAERPEFMVKVMTINGASVELGDDIREVLPVDFPVSSFDLDLEEMKGTVEKLDAVATAELHVRPGGILQLEVTERIPAVIWRNRATLELLDAEGRRVAAIVRRTDRRDLPLVVGEGADAAVPEALKLFAVSRPLEARLRGLIRMGERRWDVALLRDQRIMLPENGALAALESAIALDQAQDLLARDVSHFDLRKSGRPTLRVGDTAIEEFHRIKALNVGGQ